jgi:hypothetical protein
MTEQQHPITPPLELVKQWEEDWYRLKVKHIGAKSYIAYRAAQWGADQELEACCVWLHLHGPWGLLVDLRAARRQKPPSLKEQALKALDEALFMADDNPPEGICSDQADTIRRALEAIPDE